MPDRSAERAVCPQGGGGRPRSLEWLTTAPAATGTEQPNGFQMV
ncbi:hypothetical protein L248_0687 [Schleiferilactobacillus shenzhenensis LY-73]|uniref:Uncharacterized protein n=1 Tax=Schleiferilactobacillus shenzhenensis LY-73 TaxID=1231336 RepID=U4TMH9_9LACO|nr:hypothetical protein L248_0687 [Schleiferilactobacillus shenzhenensis LY-73]